jgi:hypothetical protein
VLATETREVVSPSAWTPENWRVLRDDASFLRPIRNGFLASNSVSALDHQVAAACADLDATYLDRVASVVRDTMDAYARRVPDPAVAHRVRTAGFVAVAAPYGVGTIFSDGRHELGTECCGWPAGHAHEPFQRQVGAPLLHAWNRAETLGARLRAVVEAFTAVYTLLGPHDVVNDVVELGVVVREDGAVRLHYLKPTPCDTLLGMTDAQLEETLLCLSPV